MKTLLLDVALWDLVLDANRNIASASPPYALAQDVASAQQAVLGEVYYDDTLGIPWLPSTSPGAVLGNSPPLALLQEYLVNAAVNQSTPQGADVYVVNAVVVFQSFVTRAVTGQTQFTDSTGQPGTVAIGSTS